MLGLLQCPTRLPSWSTILTTALLGFPRIRNSNGTANPRGPLWLKPLRMQGSFSTDSHPSQSSLGSVSLGGCWNAHSQVRLQPLPLCQHFVSKLHISIGSLRGLNELIPVMGSEWSLVNSKYLMLLLKSEVIMSRWLSRSRIRWGERRQDTSTRDKSPALQMLLPPTGKAPEFSTGYEETSKLVDGSAQASSCCASQSMEPTHWSPSKDGRTNS